MLMVKKHVFQNRGSTTLIVTVLFGPINLFLTFINVMQGSRRI